MKIKLVVGLGNPGKQYENTRHNMGFKVLDEIAKRLVVFKWKEKDGALYIKNEYMSALVKYAFLTEEEIENAVDIYSEEGTDYTFLAEVSIQRMEEAFR